MFLLHLQIVPQKWMLSFLQLDKQFYTLPQSSGSHPQLRWRTVNKQPNHDVLMEPHIWVMLSVCHISIFSHS